MASSNRHWPSLFKSKPCNSHHQWQHDINSSLISTTCQKTPHTPGCEERSPEPKPRWNPKPEQIRILEAIFNSGMVNPPREEIRKIRAQLQEYGQVGDANVFYWFQNRKSRSKHKQRHPQTAQQKQISPHQAPFPSLDPTSSIGGPPATSSSSSSSEKSSPSSIKIKTLGAAGGTTNMMEISYSPTASVNQGLYQGDNSTTHDPFYFQVQSGSSGFSQSCLFSELSKMVQFAELTAFAAAGGDSKNLEKIKPEQNQSYTTNGIPEVGDSIAFGIAAAPPKLMVFINDVAFEVAMGPLNLRELFGDEAVLYDSTGHPVPTNNWGVTLGALQHGAYYYLV